MKVEAILFDMDGVLVDVSNSYRLAIKKTAEYFLNEKIDASAITMFMNKGGYNNDWDLTEAILQSYGKRVELNQIIDKFQKFYLGDNSNGFIRNENWLLDLSVLTYLYTNYSLGIVTGRPRIEAEFVLRRFEVEKYFQVLITLEDTPRDKWKPHPYGIQKAIEKLGVKNALYLGDTIDDMKAATAADIIPIGILTTHNANIAQQQLLKQHGAKYVLISVNEILKVFDENK